MRTDRRMWTVTFFPKFTNAPIGNAERLLAPNVDQCYESWKNKQFFLK